MHRIAKLYETLVEAVDDVVFVVGPDMRYQMFNERGLRRLGFDPKDVIGRTPSEAFGHEIGARFEKNNRQVIDEKKPLLLEEWLSFGDRRVCYSTVLTPIAGERGDAIAVVGIGRDISDLKRMSEELATYTKEMEAIVGQRVRYERLIASLTQEAIRRQPHSNFLATVMRRLGEALGASRAYLFEYDAIHREVNCVHEWAAPGIESSPEIFAHIKLEDQPWAAGELLSDRVIRVEDVESIGAPEFREMLKGQGIKSILIAPIISFGKPFGFVGLEECVLHRRWEDMDVELLRVVGGIITQTVERRRLEDEILKAERLAATGRLAAGLAHEINNPLQGILLHLEALSGHVDAAKERNFGFVVEGFARISAIISRLLDIHRYVRKSERVDLNALLGEVVQLVANQLRLGNIEVRWGLKEDIPAVRGDRSQIHQVLLNVVLNAVDSMAGGGTLTLSSKRAEEGIEIDITDTGAGIAAEQMPYLFDPFFSTKGASGTGLGLFVSHAIIAEHGGKIEVRSKLGAGTAVRIVLPRYSDGDGRKREGGDRDG